MNSRLRILFFGFALFLFFTGNSFADIPLPFPDSPEENPISSEAETSSEDKLADSEKKEISAEPAASSQTEEAIPNSPKEDTVVPKKVATRSTKLPNLGEKKEKKSAKKKDAQDPSLAAYERGLVRLRNGQKEAAKEEFSKAASTEGTASSQAKLELSKLGESKAPDSGSDTGADDSVWKTSLETARSLRAQGKNSEAESILLKVATEGGNEFRSRALLQLGDMMFRQGKYQDSRSYLMDFWNRFGKNYPNAEDPGSKEFKSQREEKELGAYLLFKSSYKAGEGEWAKRFLKKYLDKSGAESSGRYSPLRAEMETLSKSDL